MLLTKNSRTIRKLENMQFHGKFFLNINNVIMIIEIGIRKKIENSKLRVLIVLIVVWVSCDVIF